MNRCEYINYATVDFSSPEEIEAYAKQLKGMTFRDVLNLEIAPEKAQANYGDKRYKGGMGVLLEECYFGYSANSKQEADFSEAGVELKATCYDVKKNGDPSAGERLVLTMIPYDCPIEDDFYESHAWEKSAKILLIYYERDRTINSYDQEIKYAMLFTPPEEDLLIIEDDYQKIVSMVKQGRAHELSESLTSYLGACTKGSTAERSWVDQFYNPGTKAKRRAFCFKRQYMDYVLHHYIMGEAESKGVIKNSEVLKKYTLEEYVLSLLNSYKGKTDKELCESLGIEYTGNKAQWSQISAKLVNLLLDVSRETIPEFEKANISVRSVRVNKKEKLVESLSLYDVNFLELDKTTWEKSFLNRYFEETRFLFNVFKENEKGEYVLAGSKFWSMPQSDIDGPLKECWENVQRVIHEGVEFSHRPQKNGADVILNNLPKKADNPIAHIRPHASKSAYKLKDGTIRGNLERDGDELPDGQIMTKQSFWLNNDYVYGVISDF